MKILYISSVCSQPYFNSLQKKKIVGNIYQNQKYHHLLLEGLNKCVDGEITVVSACTINRKVKYVHGYEEKVEGIIYHYLSYLNKPIIYRIQIFFKTLFLLLKIADRSTLLVCNALDFDECTAAQLVSKFKGIKILGIVTDVPGYTSGAVSSTTSFIGRLLMKIFLPYYKNALHNYDAYVLLTEAMDKVVNPHRKPYIVVEGFCDNKMKYVSNNFADKNIPKTIVYAGSIHKEYGIQLLVEAFISINKGKDWELHIYGGGNYSIELDEKCQVYDNIKYFGICGNEEVVEAQRKATLLVNPRPTKDDFVKYSFPSKTFECMVSGTPLLTTRLPGMPAEYYNYVYFIDKETIGGVADSLERIMNLPIENLIKKGRDAKEFVLLNKNNNKQAELIYSFIKSF